MFFEIRRTVPLVIWAFFTLPLWADPILLHNEVSIGNDEETPDSPYQSQVSLWEQRYKGFLDVFKGASTGLEAGLLVQHSGASDPQVQAWPLLDFYYHTDTARFVLGTLKNDRQHGYIDPLESHLLGYTRPVEYGLQWLEKDRGLSSDCFLDWQYLNTEGQPEVFDYGTVIEAPVDENLTMEVQFHGYHEGGKLYFVKVVNNYVPALGANWAGPLGTWGDGSLDLFGLFSTDFTGQYITGPDWGRGLYLKAGFTPTHWVGIYGLAYAGQGFFSQEGNPNYNSPGLNGYTRNDRSYDEAGFEEKLVDGNLDLDAQAAAVWVDGQLGFLGRLDLRADLDTPIPVEEKKDGLHADPKGF